MVFWKMLKKKKNQPLYAKSGNSEAGNRVISGNMSEETNYPIRRGQCAPQQPRDYTGCTCRCANAPQTRPRGEMNGGWYNETVKGSRIRTWLRDAELCHQGAMIWAIFRFGFSIGSDSEFGASSMKNNNYFFLATVIGYAPDISLEILKILKFSVKI